MPIPDFSSSLQPAFRQQAAMDRQSKIAALSGLGQGIQQGVGSFSQAIRDLAEARLMQERIDAQRKFQQDQAGLDRDAAADRQQAQLDAFSNRAEARRNFEKERRRRGEILARAPRVFTQDEVLGRVTDHLMQQPGAENIPLERISKQARAEIAKTMGSGNIMEFFRRFGFVPATADERQSRERFEVETETERARQERLRKQAEESVAVRREIEEGKRERAANLNEIRSERIKVSRERIKDINERFKARMKQTRTLQNARRFDDAISGLRGLEEDFMSQLTQVEKAIATNRERSFSPAVADAANAGLINQREALQTRVDQIRKRLEGFGESPGGSDPIARQIGLPLVSRFRKAIDSGQMTLQEAAERLATEGQVDATIEDIKRALRR